MLDCEPCRLSRLTSPEVLDKPFSCAKCGQTNPALKSRGRNLCRRCVADRVMARYVHKRSPTNLHRIAHQSGKGVELQRYRAVRTRALNHGVIFTLSWERFLELRAQTSCPVCAIKYEPLASDQHNRSRAISIDRLVPRFGYTDENCHAICYRCNAIKQDATSGEIRRVADWIDEVSRDRCI